MALHTPGHPGWEPRRLERDLRAYEDGDIREIDVFVEHSGRKQRGKGKPLFRARLIIKRKDAEAAERAMKTAKRGHQRR